MKYPIPYRLNDKWGFSDIEKSIIIKCIYDEVIFPFSEENFNLSLVKLGEKFCWINVDGKPISPLGDNIHPFTKEEISLVVIDKENFKTRKTSENCLFINRFGEKAFSIQAITANGFQNGFCIVYFPNNFYGAINEKGEVVIEPEYDKYETVWEKIGKPYFYDKKERTKSIEPLVKFEKDRYIGFKDQNDNILIQPTYFWASDFYDGTCCVAKEPKKFHHIDLNGQRLYSQNYYFGFNYHFGIAKVVTDSPNVDPFVHSRWGVDYHIPEESKWGYIDKQGNEYWEDK